MMGNRVLITGINGLIGGILQPALQDSYEVYGFDRAGPFSIRVLEAELSDFREVEAVFMRFSPLDYVVHLAGKVGKRAEWEPILQDNIIGTRNLYEAARIAGVRRVVFASSNHVTGAYEGFAPNLHLHTQYEPELLTVEHPIRPDSDYGVSKAFGEALARYYCARWGIESVCLRIGSVLPDDDPTQEPRYRKTWLSHRDLVQLVSKSLAASVVFGIYYGISGNKGAFWDISNAVQDLGYTPQDDASMK